MQTLQDISIPKEKKYTSDLGITEIQKVNLAGFQLKNGTFLEDFELAYMTLGNMSPSKDNVILICHALSGTAHVAGIDKDTGRPGWWDFHVGPGKSIDTNHFYVISTNIIGGCNGSFGPSSNQYTKIENGDKITLNQKIGMNFPNITIEDMVEAQVRLIDFLKIETIYAVIGGSLGGMQALVWQQDTLREFNIAFP